MTPNTRFLTAALLIAFWGGAAILTIAIVTPAAFAVLPTRALAGSLVGRVLPALFLSRRLRFPPAPAARPPPPPSRHSPARSPSS
jgi:hypothetical protein